MHLRLDYCSHEAALYAVTHWHYSHSIPAGKLVKIGVWEEGEFTGCIIYSYGANHNLAKSFGLSQTEVCELTRIALREHRTAVSRLVSISLRLLKRHCPGIKVVVSYADLDRGHLGAIYQAANWTYVGRMTEGECCAFVLNGRRMHKRSVGARGWTQSLPWLREHIDPHATTVRTQGKHKYLWFFDEEIRGRIKSQPYPKRVEVNDAATG